MITLQANRAQMQYLQKFLTAMDILSIFGEVEVLTSIIQ